jgi:predicted metal-binding membrane protein
MGLQHGLYCVGCCWALMLLLFAGGVMSLGWMAGLSLFVLLEKLSPFGVAGDRATGALLLAAAAALLGSSLVSG